MLNWAWQNKARQSWSKSNGKSSWREKYTQWLANWLCILAVICMFSSIVCIFQSHKQNTHSRTQTHSQSDTVTFYLFIHSTHTVGISILQPILFVLPNGVNRCTQVNKANGIFNANTLRAYIVYMCLCNSFFFFFFFLFSSWKIQCHCIFFSLQLCYDFAVSFFYLISNTFMHVLCLFVFFSFSQFLRTFLLRMVITIPKTWFWSKRTTEKWIRVLKTIKKQHLTQSK